MKKLIFSFFLVFLVKTLAFTQIGKGVYTFKPDFDVSTSPIIRGHYSNFTPDFGVFINSKLLLSGQINASVDNYYNNGTYKQTAASLNARYYYKDAGKWKPYVNAGVGIGKDKYLEFKNFVGNGFVNFEYKILTWALGTGVQYFLNPNVAIDANLSYSVSDYKTTLTPQNSKFKYHNTAFSIGLRPFFTTASIKESKETTDFLAEGRIMPFANILLSNLKTTGNTKSEYNNFNGNFGAEYFLSKHFSAGGSFSFSKRGVGDYIAAGGSMAYFFHLKKRAYLSLGLKSTFTHLLNANVLVSNGLTYTPSVDFYYFLNQKIALDAGLHYETRVAPKIFQPLDKGFFDIGLKYFLN